MSKENNMSEKNALRRLATLRDPQAVVDYAKPYSGFKFALMRVGFEGCDDEDAQVALALTDSLESFINFVYDSPSISMSPILAAAVTKYTDETAPVMNAVKEMSLVRAQVLGREIPKFEDFTPKTEGSNSGVADRVEPSVPAFIPPQNERKV